MIKPMLCRTSKDENVLDNNEYYSEIKYDGERVIAFVSTKGVFLQRRSGADCSTRYPEIIEQLTKLRTHLDDDVILDGEFVVFNNGVSDFQALQRRIHVQSKIKIDYRSKNTPVTYVIFDVVDMNALIEERYTTLQQVYQKAIDNGVKHLELAPRYSNSSRKLFERAVTEGREGIILKKIKSKYVQGRSANWLKIKNISESDLVFNGYEPNNAGIKLIKSERHELDEIDLNLPISVQCSGAQSEVVQQSLDKYGFVLASIKYLGITDDNKLRMPTFKKIVVTQFKETSKPVIKTKKPKSKRTLVVNANAQGDLLKSERLHFIGGTSDKFYHIDLHRDGSDGYLSIAYGRTGKNPNKSTKKMAFEAAEKEFNKKLKQKLKKGYVRD